MTKRGRLTHGDSTNVNESLAAFFAFELAILFDILLGDKGRSHDLAYEMPLDYCDGRTRVVFGSRSGQFINFFRIFVVLAFALLLLVFFATGSG